MQAGAHAHKNTPHVVVQLTLEQQGFELHGFTHTQIFFNKYMLQSYTTG